MKQKRQAGKLSVNPQKTPPSGVDVVNQTDPLNFVVVKVDPFYNDLQLGNATGFFYYGTLDGKPNFWLVTNWHVLSGRNADYPTKTLHQSAAVPNRLRLNLLIKFDQPEYKVDNAATLLFQEQFIELYDKDGQAMWAQNIRKNALDVAVLNGSVFVDRFHLVGINQIATESDMAVQIGNDVFILGYPLGFAHFINTPIWKKGSIASEPHLETTETKDRVVIDATTRQGMSGAPVIMREKTHYVAESGEIKRRANATRFIGIYASRPNIRVASSLDDEDRRAELGYYYKMSCVHDTIVNGIRGPNFGEWPEVP
jgi:hypothetical protein